MPPPCLPRHPRRVPCPLGAGYRPGRQRAVWGGSSPSPRSPLWAHHAGAASPRCVASGSTPKCSTPTAHPLADSRSPRLVMASPCSVPCSADPGTGSGPSAPPGGSSLPGHPSVRIFMRLNLPWLRVLRAAVSLMPGAWVNQCSSPQCVGNMNQAGERFPNITAHSWGVSAAPPGCTTLLPAMERAPSERIHSPASVGRGGGQATGGSHGEPGEAVGCRSRRESILVSPWQRDCSVCWFGPRNRRRLGSSPERQPARGRTDSGDVLRNKVGKAP